MAETAHQVDCMCKPIGRLMNAILAAEEQKALANSGNRVTYIMCNTSTDSQQLHEIFKNRVARTKPNPVKMAAIPEQIRLVEERRRRAPEEQEKRLHKPDLDRKSSLLTHMHHGDEDEDGHPAKPDYDDPADDTTYSADDTANDAEDTANVTNDITNTADDTATAADDIANIADNTADAADDNKNAVDDTAVEDDSAMANITTDAVDTNTADNTN